MIGKGLGATRRTPAPSGAVVTEALSLLAAFGGGNKDFKKLLNEMKEVQEHNEKMLEEATLAISEAKKELEKLEAERNTFNAEQEEMRERNQRLSEMLAQRDRKVTIDEENLRRKVQIANADIDAREKEVQDLEKSILDREADCVAKEKQANEMQKMADKRHSELDARQSDLESKYARLLEVIGK